MFRRFMLLSLFLPALLLTAGCWDANDIGKRSVVLTAAIDLSQAGTTQFGAPVRYEATILMPNLEHETPNKVRIEKTAGASLSGSRDQRSYVNPEEILVRMTNVVLFGESLAESGLHPVLDSFQRNPVINNSLKIAMTEGQAGDILLIEPQDFPDLAMFLTDLLTEIRNKSFFPVVTLHDFYLQSSSRGKNPVLPILKVDNGEVKICGVGIFSKDKLIAKIGLDQTRPLSLLRNCKGQAYLPFLISREGEILDRGTVFAANDRQVKVKREGGQLVYSITITLEGDLIEHEARNDLLQDRDYLALIEEQIAADIEDECRIFLQMMQEDFKLDCIDISKYALAKWRGELIDSIDQGLIEKAKIDVDVEVHIQNIGDMT